MTAPSVLVSLAIRGVAVRGSMDSNELDGHHALSGPIGTPSNTSTSKPWESGAWARAGRKRGGAASGAGLSQQPSGPAEANRIHPTLYGCDCNNVSPRLSLAIQTYQGWVIRTGYTVSFGEVPPVT